mmetsp:Transcript_23027/g.30064  ORF Transcript_23027/g.30064 Transcript_23027/m.30064 type:complete len:345 (+) Transcript_23027:213-1247(+)
MPLTQTSFTACALISCISFVTSFIFDPSTSKNSLLNRKTELCSVSLKKHDLQHRSAMHLSHKIQMSSDLPIPRYSIVFMRHGESEWNNENIFTGWVDVPLTKKGENEAKAAGQLMKEEGMEFDIVYTSYLKRAIKTSWKVLDEMNLTFVPVQKDWKLNEQMYGNLEGRNKVQCVLEHGLEKVQKWRRSYEIAPPEKEGDGYFPANDPKYASFTDDDAPDSWCGKPQTESLKDTQSRAWRLWREEIAPSLRQGKKVLVCCHGNTLRALLRRLDSISNEELMQLDIPRAVPLIYTLDKNMKPIKHSRSMLPLSGRFIGDIAEVRSMSLIGNLHLFKSPDFYITHFV